MHGIGYYLVRLFLQFFAFFSKYLLIFLLTAIGPMNFSKSALSYNCMNCDRAELTHC